MAVEMVDVKVSIPCMFTAQKVFDYITYDEVLQKELKDGCLYGEYRDPAFKFTDISDMQTIHLDRVIYTIREIYLSPTCRGELRMAILFDDNLSPTSSLLKGIYKMEPKLISFVVRGLYSYDKIEDAYTLDKVITIDGMLNNPRTYYNTEGGGNTMSGLRSADGFCERDPEMVVSYWAFH